LGSEVRFHGGREGGGGRSKNVSEVSVRTVIFGLVVDMVVLVEEVGREWGLVG